MNKKLIKNRLSETFLDEAVVPGVSQTKKTQKETGKFNKEYYKEVKGKMKKYDSASKSEDTDAIEEPKTNIEGDTETYHDEMEIMNGQEMIQYQNEPSERFKDRAEKAIAGDATMGNSPDYANVVPKQQGFTGPDFGKNLVKSIKSSKKKRDDQTPEFNSLGDDIEIKKNKTDKRKVAVESTNKKNIMEENKIKRATFKNPFDGLGNALNLVPESYKVDTKVFEMTDGNESYRMRWEGTLNEGKAVVLTAKDQNMINEDMDKMKHLMGFNSQDTLGIVKGKARIDENSTFSDIMTKTKALMTEAEDKADVTPTAEKKKINENVGNAVGAGTQGFVKEDDLEENDIPVVETEIPVVEGDDVASAEQRVTNNATTVAALQKLNLPQEEIEFCVKFVDYIAPRDAVKRIIAKELLAGINAPEAEAEPEAVPEAVRIAEADKGAIKSKNHADYVMTEDGEEAIEETDRFDEVFSGLDEDEVVEENALTSPAQLDPEELAEGSDPDEDDDLGDSSGYGGVPEL